MKANAKRTEVLQPEPLPPRPRYRIEEHRSALSDWLEIDWFYPDGFKKQRIIETPEALIACGETLSYTFLRSTVGAESVSFAKRWKHACEEILGNNELAPDLYIGVRLLAWQDGELHWLSEYRGTDLRPSCPPAGADEIALISRRIPDTAKLSDYLLDGGEIRFKQIDHIIAHLTRFHKRRSKKSRQLYLDEPIASLDFFEQSTLRKIDTFIDESANFLDPFSRATVLETFGAIQHLYSQNKELLLQRAKEGLCIDGHGRLRASTITIEPLCEEGAAICISGRARPEERQQDVLADVASLTVDLEIMDADYLAEELERRYFLEFPCAANTQLLLMFRLAAALEIVIESYEFAGALDMPRAHKALAFALRSALGIPKRFALVVCGKIDDESEALAQAIAELLGVICIEPRLISEELGLEHLLDNFVFDRISDRLARLLRIGRGIVAACPCTDVDQKTQLHRLLRKEQIPYLLIDCQGEKDEQHLTSRNVPTHSQPRLALEVLREFSDRIHCSGDHHKESAVTCKH